jgi:hypothetical protein
MQKRARLSFLVTAIGVVLVMVFASWFFLVDRSSTPGRPPCTVPTLGTLHQYGAGDQEFWNYSVGPPGPVGYVYGPWNASAILIGGYAGGILSTTSPGWNVTVWNGSGSMAAVYDIRAVHPTWTVGGSSLPSQDERFVIASPSSVWLGMDFIWLDSTGSCTGNHGIEVNPQPG